MLKSNEKMSFLKAVSLLYEREPNLLTVPDEVSQASLIQSTFEFRIEPP